jgi:hypothetical protein
MSVTYKITQVVKTAYKKRMEVIYENPVERMAITEYRRLIVENPDEYFELLETSYTENALEWTGKTDG